MAPHIDMPDLSSLENPFDVAEAGRYPIEVAKCEATTTKESGKPAIKLEHKIIGDSKHAGKMIFETLVMDPASKGYKFSLWRWKEYCQAVGSDGKDTDDILGKRFEVEVGVRPGNEEYPNPQNVIKKVYGAA